MSKQVCISKIGGGIGGGQTAPTRVRYKDGEVLKKRINEVRSELYNLNSSNIRIRKGKMNYSEYIGILLAEVEEMVDLGYVDEAWRSLRNLCKEMAGMNLATQAMIKVIIR